MAAYAERGAHLGWREEGEELWEAARVEPQVRADVDEVLSGLEGLFEEDSERDERLAAVLARHHLNGLVEMIVENLSSEPETA